MTEGTASHARATGSTTTDVPPLSTAQIIRNTLAVLAVVVAFWLAHRFAGALFTLFAAMVLGTAVRPGLVWLHRRAGLSRHMSALVLFTGLLAFVVTAAVVVVPVALGQASALATKLPGYVASARLSLMASPSATVRRVALELPVVPPAELARPAPAVVDDTLSGLELMATSAFGLIAILLLGFHWTTDGEVAVRALLLFAPLERRDGLRELVDAAEEKVGGYVRGQLVVCAVTTVLSLAAFAWIGLPNALVLALVAGAMGAVPVVGGVLAGGVAVLAAAHEPRLVQWVIGFAVAIHLVQEYVVAPLVMGKRVGVHPFTILLAISGFGSLLGVAGAVLAIPMAAIIQLLLDRFVFDTAHDQQPVLRTPHRDRTGVLSLEARTLALDARRQARSEALADPRLDEAKHLVESIAHDLDRILTVQPPPGATS